MMMALVNWIYLSKKTSESFLFVNTIIICFLHDSIHIFVIVIIKKSYQINLQLSMFLFCLGHQFNLYDTDDNNLLQHDCLYYYVLDNTVTYNELCHICHS